MLYYLQNISKVYSKKTSSRVAYRSSICVDLNEKTRYKASCEYLQNVQLEDPRVAEWMPHVFRKN